jgi:hypothetical protein
MHELYTKNQRMYAHFLSTLKDQDVVFVPKHYVATPFNEPLNKLNNLK